MKQLQKKKTVQNVYMETWDAHTETQKKPHKDEKGLERDEQLQRDASPWHAVPLCVCQSVHKGGMSSLLHVCARSPLSHNCPCVV